MYAYCTIHQRPGHLTVWHTFAYRRIWVTYIHNMGETVRQWKARVSQGKVEWNNT